MDRIQVTKKGQNIVDSFFIKEEYFTADYIKLQARHKG